MVNREEDTKEAVLLLLELKELIEKARENCDERTKQGNLLRYYEQKLYHLVLAGRYNEAADELIDYPYRMADKTMKKYIYIRNNCISEEGSQEQDFDKHRLWDNVWY